MFYYAFKKIGMLQDAKIKPLRESHKRCVEQVLRNFVYEQSCSYYPAKEVAEDEDRVEAVFFRRPGRRRPGRDGHSGGDRRTEWKVRECSEKKRQARVAVLHVHSLDAVRAISDRDDDDGLLRHRGPDRRLLQDGASRQIHYMFSGHFSTIKR